MNILIFRPGQMGDSLVAMPAIYDIRCKYPEAKFFLLTDRQESNNRFISSWEILGPTGWFDKVFFYEPYFSGWKKLSMLYNIIRKLDHCSIDKIFDLSPERSWFQFIRDKFFLKRLLRIPDYYGSGAFHYPARNPTGELPKLCSEWHRLCKIVGNNQINDDFRLNIPEQYFLNVESMLQESGICKDSVLLSLAPGSKMPSKIWPKRRYLEVGHQLLKRYPSLELLVLGGPDDEKLGNELVSEWGTRAHNFAGKTTLYESAALLSRSVAYVGNDTGVMHMAGLLGIPCVGIFSARDYPGMWEPYGHGHVVLRKSIECSRCMLEECIENKNKCLTLISTDEVIKAVITLL